MKILSVAHALPSKRVGNEEILEHFSALNRTEHSESELDRLRDFLADRLSESGAGTRFHRGPGEAALGFGVAAGREALSRAGIEAEDVDLLIYTGVGRGFIEPATANVFQAELGLEGATCFDVLDACASWMRGLEVARSLLASGTYRTAMILNCEFNFRDYEPGTVSSLDELDAQWAAYTIGEAATATLLTAGDLSDEYHLTFRSIGSHVDLCQIPLPHASEYLNGATRPERRALRFYSDTRALAKHAVRSLRDQYWSDPQLHGMTYDVIFGHSASVPLSRLVLRTLKLEAERHYEVFPLLGNTVSAGLPIAMSLAIDEGRLERGHRVLLIMGGAGITTGFCTFVY